jgi:hypothetical protein
MQDIEMEDEDDNFPYNYPVESYIFVQHYPVIGKIPMGKFPSIIL